MKRMAILLVGLWLWLPGSAQWYEDFHDGFYDEYLEDAGDDLYKFGFMIDNYAAAYSDRFIIEMAREYGVPRSDLRYYLRRGYAPSDLLFGLELARRSGYRLKHIMNRYYRSADRNWVSISIALGIGRGSTGFRLIVDRFRHQYRYWNDYYVRRNPHRHPPVYQHAWSYFRPQAHHAATRPVPPPRPAPAHRPGPARPQHPVVPARPRTEIHGTPRPGASSRPANPTRPSAPDRPQRKDTPATPARPSQSPRNVRPEKRPANRQNVPAKKKDSDYRRETAPDRKTAPAQQEKPVERKGYRR